MDYDIGFSPVARVERNILFRITGHHLDAAGNILLLLGTFVTVIEKALNVDGFRRRELFTLPHFGYGFNRARL